jgi:hypothetical protein
MRFLAIRYGTKNNGQPFTLIARANGISVNDTPESPIGIQSDNLFADTYPDLRNL